MVRIRERFEIQDEQETNDLHGVIRFSAIETNTGLERNLKLWHKRGTPMDMHLRTLWRYELRQVQRVMAYSGAKDLIVDVVEFVEDEVEFGMVIERSGFQLYEWLLKLNKNHWLKNCGVPQNRMIMWRNVSRIASGLGIVHAQGLVHGQIGTQAIHTNAGVEPDFRLGGLEWSLRLSVSDDGFGKVADELRERGKVYSFASDWLSLGLLIAELLGVRFDKYGEPASSIEIAGMGLTVSERILLKKLINPSRLDMLDSASIVKSIDSIITSITHAASSQAGTLMVLFSPNSRMGAAIYNVTGGAITEDDYAGQIEWIKGDLSSAVTMKVPQGFSIQTGVLRLVTENMVYKLSPYQDQRDPSSSSSWEVGFCNDVQIRGLDIGGDNGDEQVIDQPVRIFSNHKECRVTRSQLGPDVLDWGVLAGGGVSEAVQSIDVVKKALRLVQTVEAVIKAVESYSVEVVGYRLFQGRHYVRLRPTIISETDRLAKRLGQSNSNDAFRILFGEEAQHSDSKWRLSDSPGLASGRNEDVIATFFDVVSKDGAPVYEFEINEHRLEINQVVFLRGDSESGTVQVIRRRLNIISSLDTRMDLLALLDDPWRARRVIRNVLDENDEAFKDLDQPKQTALRLLWSTLPVFYVVGPPGVGKTRLATEVLRRKLQEDISSRLFISAQGHDALDNLQTAIGEIFSGSDMDDLIVVRSRTPENRGANDDGVQSNVVDVLERLNISAMVANAPKIIKDKIVSIRDSAVQQQVSSRNLTKDELSGLRAISNLILDSANIVISTANSEDVERMVEEREQFDWVIVEEAAKAIGPELIGPLMLSGRRLLIGDHHQLPPFGMDKILKVLQNYTSVECVLSMSERLLGNIYFEAGLDEVSDLIKDPSQLRNVLSSAIRLLQPFGTFVKEDERKASLNSLHRPISAELTEQRRMDPAIAEIVSKAFYDGKLITAQARIQKLEIEKPPFVNLYPLSNSPVVVVDFDHVSNTGSRSPLESHQPRWNNESEVQSVIDVLRSVRAQDGEAKKPTLAILSPYKAQVKKIQLKIASLIDGELVHLKAFRSVRGGDDFVGTVDSFQGSEADLVVISMVRNNPKAGRSALGFLQESSRMNVMLSRAKWQMVIVGSLSFLEEAVRGVNPDNTDHDLSFITKMLGAIESLKKELRKGVPLVDVVKPKSLRKR